MINSRSSNFKSVLCPQKKVVEYFRKIGNFKQMKLNYRNENYKKLKVAEIRSQIFFMEI